jgi:aminoglycoside phosphotransferase (APT) family kinase protein
MPGSFDPIPVAAESVLDPAWVHTAFALGPDERVVEVVPVDALKTVADKLRFRVEIDDGGTGRTLHCCAKAHFGETGPGSLVTEAHAYRDLLPHVGVRAPRTHHVAVDDAAGRAIVVMDDVEAQGGRFLSAHEPYDVDLVRATLSQLALLHASTWDDRRWSRLDWLAPRYGMVDWFTDEKLQSLLDDGRGPDVPAYLRDAAHLRAAVERSAEMPGTCVVHGDTHSGNSYLDADGTSHWLDWQITQWGPWALDVSYHLGTVLTIDDRRAHETALVAHYVDELASHGVAAPSAADAFDAYASGFAWGWFLWVITSISSRAVVLEHVPRLTTAIDDHRSLARLGVV